MRKISIYSTVFLFLSILWIETTKAETTSETYRQEYQFFNIWLRTITAKLTECARRADIMGLHLCIFGQHRHSHTQIYKMALGQEYPAQGPI